MNHDFSFVVTITMTCYSWVPSGGDHIFTCGAISRPPQWLHVSIRGISFSLLFQNFPSISFRY